MQAQPDLELDEDFFQQGDAGIFAGEPVRGASLAPVELEAEVAPALRPEQWARAGRFRGQVAAFVTALGLGVVWLLIQARRHVASESAASAVTATYLVRTPERAVTERVVLSAPLAAPSDAAQAVSPMTAASASPRRNPPLAPSALPSPLERGRNATGPTVRANVNVLASLPRSALQSPRTVAESLAAKPSTGAPSTARFPDLP